MNESLLNALRVGALVFAIMEPNYKIPREVPPKSMPKKRSHKSMNRNRKKK